MTHVRSRGGQRQDEEPVIFQVAVGARFVPFFPIRCLRSSRNQLSPTIPRAAMLRQQFLSLPALPFLPVANRRGHGL